MTTTFYHFNQKYILYSEKTYALVSGYVKFVEKIAFHRVKFASNPGKSWLYVFKLGFSDYVYRSTLIMLILFWPRGEIKVFFQFPNNVKFFLKCKNQWRSSTVVLFIVLFHEIKFVVWRACFAECLVTDHDFQMFPLFLLFRVIALLSHRILLL